MPTTVKCAKYSTEHKAVRFFITKGVAAILGTHVKIAIVPGDKPIIQFRPGLISDHRIHKNARETEIHISVPQHKLPTFMSERHGRTDLECVFDKEAKQLDVVLPTKEQLIPVGAHEMPARKPRPAIVPDIMSQTSQSYARAALKTLNDFLKANQKTTVASINDAGLVEIGTLTVVKWN